MTTERVWLGLHRARGRFSKAENQDGLTKYYHMGQIHPELSDGESKYLLTQVVRFRAPEFYQTLVQQKRNPSAGRRGVPDCAGAKY